MQKTSSWWETLDYGLTSQELLEVEKLSNRVAEKMREYSKIKL